MDLAAGRRSIIERVRGAISPPPEFGIGLPSPKRFAETHIAKSVVRIPEMSMDIEPPKLAPLLRASVKRTAAVFAATEPDSRSEEKMSVGNLSRWYNTSNAYSSIAAREFVSL